LLRNGFRRGCRAGASSANAPINAQIATLAEHIARLNTSPGRVAAAAKESLAKLLEERRALL